MQPIVDKRVVTQKKTAVDMWEIDVPSILDRIRNDACIDMISGKIDTISGYIAKSFIILATSSSTNKILFVFSLFVYLLFLFLFLFL